MELGYYFSIFWNSTITKRKEVKYKDKLLFLLLFFIDSHHLSFYLSFIFCSFSHSRCIIISFTSVLFDLPFSLSLLIFCSLSLSLPSPIFLNFFLFWTLHLKLWIFSFPERGASVILLFFVLFLSFPSSLLCLFIPFFYLYLSLPPSLPSIFFSLPPVLSYSARFLLEIFDRSNRVPFFRCVLESCFWRWKIETR